MDSKPRSGGLSGEEKRIFMDMVSTATCGQHLQSCALGLKCRHLQPCLHCKPWHWHHHRLLHAVVRLRAFKHSPNWALNTMQRCLCHNVQNDYISSWSKDLAMDVLPEVARYLPAPIGGALS